jgi:predicted Zn-dependent protease/predicted regulator of Ras-like GTPase activity (Roadblock/LC7/MglB family)
MADDVRLWSDELARDPSSLVFLPLAESLRKQGQLDTARKVATRGLQRHPHNPDAHDLLARILVDAGEFQAAFDEWDVVLRIVPGHVGATKGMAFVLFQQGKHEDAERMLVKAQALGGGDAAGGDIRAAINTVRRSSSVASVMATTGEMQAMSGDPRHLFRDILQEGQTAIMLDKDGLVLAGVYLSSDGRDVAEDVGATLSGLSAEALRATKHLAIGDWRSIVFETEAAVVSIAPAPAAGGLAAGGLVVIAGVPSTPLGLLKRMLDRCITRAAAWLTGASTNGAGGAA